MTVIEEIAAERQRQITKGYTAVHDDDHGNGELAMAAASFAVNRSPLYPWRPFPRLGRRKQLIQAAALIVAEIERLDRGDDPRGRRAS